jgi:hypothetical protein|tara:strand:- start:137 stop:358 length:222 start_codon:yes stop_codon:yes gene_type:complete
MKNKVRDGLMSIWGHTEMELLPLTKAELLVKMADISNIVNRLVDTVDEGECTHCGNVSVCEPCMDEMCSDIAP